MPNKPKWLFSEDNPIQVWELIGSQYHLRHILDASDTYDGNISNVGWLVNGKYAYRFATRNGSVEQYCEVINLETGLSETNPLNPSYPFSAEFNVGSDEGQRQNHLVWVNGSVVQILSERSGSSGDGVTVRKFTPNVGWEESFIYLAGSFRNTYFAKPIILPNQVVRWPMFRARTTFLGTYETVFGFFDYNTFTNTLTQTIIDTVAGPTGINEQGTSFLFESEPKPDGKIVCVTGFTGLSSQTGLYAEWHYDSVSLDASGPFSASYDLRHLHGGQFIGNKLFATIGSSIPAASTGLKVNSPDSYIILPDGSKWYFASTKTHPNVTQSYDYDLVSTITEPETTLTRGVEFYAWIFHGSITAQMRFANVRMSFDIASNTSISYVPTLGLNGDAVSSTPAYRPRGPGVELAGTMFVKTALHPSDEYLQNNDDIYVRIQTINTEESPYNRTEQMQLVSVDFPYIYYEGPFLDIYSKVFDSYNTSELGSWFDADNFYFSSFDSTDLSRGTPDEYETAVWVSAFELPGPSEAILVTSSSLTADAKLVLSADAALSAVTNFAATAITKLPVDASLSAVASLSGTIAAVRSVNSSMPAVASLGASGLVFRLVGSGMAAVATVSADAVVTRYAQTDLSATAVLASDAHIVSFLAESLDSVASLVSNATVQKLASSDLAAVATVVASAGTSRSAAASLSATAALASDALVARFAASNLSAQATLSSVAITRGSVIASMSAVAAISASSIRVVSLAAGLSATSQFDAVPLRIALGDVSLSGAASFSGSAVRVALGQSSQVATGALVANATRGALGSAALVGSVTLAASGTVEAQATAEAVLVASASLASNAVIGKSVEAALAADASLTSDAYVTKPSQASMSAAATFSASSSRLLSASSVISAIAQLDPTALTTLRVSASGEVFSTLSAEAILVEYAQANMSGGASLDSQAILGKPTQAVLSSYAVLDANAIKLLLAQAGMSAQASLFGLPYGSEVSATLAAETTLYAKPKRIRKVRFNRNTTVTVLSPVAGRGGVDKGTSITQLGQVKSKAIEDKSTEANLSVTETKAKGN